jgi:hypothetical protein
VVVDVERPHDYNSFFHGENWGPRIMRLIMGGINGDYLLNITLQCAADTEQVLAAVAYATDASLLFDWCWENKIPLKF